jgi:hypothetical protein
MNMASRQIDPDKLRAAIRRLGDEYVFCKASLAGEYYESFNVTSKRRMNKSSGTMAWIADCHRLLDCSVAQEK